MLKKLYGTIIQHLNWVQDQSISYNVNKKLRFCIVLIFFSIFFINAEAVELYSFFNNQCKEITGYLVSEEDDIYDILSIDGEIASLHKDDFKGVLVYNFVNPPLKRIKLQKDKLENIITLSVQSEGKLDTFSGFPLQFIEDLIVFLGIDGSVRVHKLDSILRIRPFGGGRTKRFEKNVNLDIQSVGYMQSCVEAGRKGSIRPNRILVDKIKIQQFLSNYGRGYEGLKNFQERTYLYARPKIYTQKTRFGIVGQKPVEKSSVGNSPFIEWSSGRPFRVQSLNQIGAVFNEYGADLDPIMGFKTEIKAHFFHSIFIGNLEALSAGADFFNYQRLNSSITTTGYADSGINYSAMVGGDFGPHSLSVVLYYPVYVFESGKEFREILATSNSYALRYMYTNSFLRFYGVTSLRDKKIEKPSHENIVAFSGNENIFPIGYGVKSFFVRSGIDVDLSGEVRAGFSLLLLNLDYNEQPNLRSMKLKRLGGTAYARKSFGDYVSFGIRFTYRTDKMSGNLSGKRFSNNKDKNVLGFEGALIF